MLGIVESIGGGGGLGEEESEDEGGEGGGGIGLTEGTGLMGGVASLMGAPGLLKGDGAPSEPLEELLTKTNLWVTFPVPRSFELGEEKGIGGSGDARDMVISTKNVAERG